MSTTDDSKVVSDPPDDDVEIGESPDGDQLNGDQARWLLTKRRSVLVALGSLGTIAAIAEADLGGSDGDLYGGTMALDKAYKVGERSYLGPESLKDGVIDDIPESEGWKYETTDTRVEYWLDDNSWQGPMPIGSASTPVSSVYTEQVVIGVDPSEGNAGVQAAVDALPADGGIVYLRRGTYTFDDRVIVDGIDDVTIQLSDAATIEINDGNWTAVDLDADTANIGEKKAAFVFRDCDNAVFRGGTIDGSGFTYEAGAGEDACGVLMKNCTESTVEQTTVNNVFPSAFSSFGGERDSDADSSKLRYNGVLFIKCADCTMFNNDAYNIKYDAFAVRVGCSGAKVIANSAERCYEGVQDTAWSVEDQFGTLIAFNTVRDSRGGGSIATHADDVTIIGNYVTGFTQKGIAVEKLTNSNPDRTVRVAHNMITSPSTGTRAINIQGAHSTGTISVEDNYVDCAGETVYAIRATNGNPHIRVSGGVIENATSENPIEINNSVASIKIADVDFIGIGAEEGIRIEGVDCPIKVTDCYYEGDGRFFHQRNSSASITEPVHVTDNTVNLASAFSGIRTQSQHVVIKDNVVTADSGDAGIEVDPLDHGDAGGVVEGNDIRGFTSSITRGSSPAPLIKDNRGNTDLQNLANVTPTDDMEVRADDGTNFSAGERAFADTASGVWRAFSDPANSTVTY